MEQIFPDRHVVDDPLALLSRDVRPTPASRPWVMSNMIASIDGAFAVGGRSGLLGGEADRTIFHTLRAVSDVVLVAAGTARTERYRRPELDDDLRTAREASGRPAVPRLAMVSRRLEIPDDLPLLTGAGPRPILFHPVDADPAAVPDAIECRAVGSGSVDLRLALELLAADGARTVLCEGGPNLLGQLHEVDLIDEFFVTMAPAGVGGADIGLFGRVPPVLRRYELHRVIEDDGFLMSTYRRRRDE